MRWTDHFMQLLPVSLPDRVRPFEHAMRVVKSQQACELRDVHYEGLSGSVGGGAGWEECSPIPRRGGGADSVSRDRRGSGVREVGW